MPCLAAAAIVIHVGGDQPPRPYVPLFWRLFVPNALVLAAACVVLIIEPANGRIPALVGGLTIMVALNLILMRRATEPLARLISLMCNVDPLAPGQRIAVGEASSEVTELSEAFNEMLDRVETERRESARRELLAQEGERRRVAAELHDEIGQGVTALVLELERSIASAQPRDRAALLRARNVAEQLLEDVRRLARSLRPEVLDELGLVPAVRNLADRLSARTGVAIRTVLPPLERPLGHDVELVIYRVAQEALTNVLRHAGAAHADVELVVRDGTAELRVSDDGKGIDTPALQGTGIRGMRERAVSVGGRVTVRPRADRSGTEVLLTLPTREPT
jgi:two-component system, NarL family, sensor histidine kinase UhpB